MNNQPDDRLSDADLARELVVVGASAAARVMREGQFKAIASKANSTDVVTAADHAAETAMSALVRLHRPQDGLLGEEGTRHQGDSGRTWVMDPLDGTYNFSRGGDRWCSAVALMESGVPVLGAVARPGHHWVGGAGAPCEGGRRRWDSVGGGRLATSSLATYLHPPFHRGPAGVAWRRLVGEVATLRMTGSGSLDAVDVARGVADISVQHSVPVWDSAPGEALVRSVGGVSARVQSAGVEWFLLGSPSGVAEAAALLEER